MLRCAVFAPCAELAYRPGRAGIGACVAHLLHVSPRLPLLLLLQVLPPSSTVAQLLQQLPGSTGGGISRGGPTRASPVIAVRHSMDAVGGNRSYLDGPTRSLNTLSGLPRCLTTPRLPSSAGCAFRSITAWGRMRGRQPPRSLDGYSSTDCLWLPWCYACPALPTACRPSRIRDTAASYYGHMSVGAMHDIANSTVTVVAGSVPAPAAPAAPRTTVSAHASSMVDAGAGQAQPAAGTFGEWFGAPEVGGWLDVRGGV